MALTPRLDLRQSQSLVMTPQLQQAIKLLQLSNIELSAFVEAELEQNPLLERDEGPAPTAEEVRESLSSDTEVAEAPMVDVVPGQTEEAPLDLDYDNTFTNNGTVDEADGIPGDYGNRGGRLDFSDDEGFESNLTREESLRDHLLG
ncbi:MAG TPA: RNA polymerase sigma-54 factor, partial [Magnetospirillaceae bacterium]|nr:RNA polymerase sigma-54 factor [Magnetospirillaceae bacterium]